ncbi:NAD/NADP-dependent betaine aldehyde dehydrogenase [Methanimicrococcus stummii]|uniref:NAD/NADP-dependent betaine aldehyde dehydrogenase n=2 Tax=Methanimicrococcus stummii TaxID=3028294 RepID=A0AA96ZYS1_9EURY|nr:NAD/NADP-dependent betaine aldehyde dehydrogenase [Methanimicrococcus sp. Es2]
MFIGGEKYTSSHPERIDVINPATGALIESVSSAVPDDVEKAIESCAFAFESWSQKSYAERGAVLSQISAALKEKKCLEKLAATLTKEQGKPLTEARREIQGVIGVIDYFTGLSSSFHTDFFENKSNQSYSFTTKAPFGVCAAVLPWNMPALILSWQMIPALLTGNTCLVKPSSICPLTVLELAAVFHEAGLPAGVFNVVTGSGDKIGKQLAASPKIQKISFTGSVSAGRNLHAEAAKFNKRVTLELGGSDAMIVCDDADVGSCAAKAVSARFFNAGQACISPKRIFVFESIFDDFIQSVSEEVSKIKIGDGFFENGAGGFAMGPLSSAEGQKQMIEFVESAKSEGSKILIGGKVPDFNKTPLENGFFFEPTVITNVPPSSRLLKEEVFGPIMVINPVKNLDEAIAAANNSDFGLGASIWTNNLNRAKRGAEELKAGIVWVNQHAKVLPELPFGGVKESGFGRENGYETLNDYLETKTVIFKF